MNVALFTLLVSLLPVHEQWSPPKKPATAHCIDASIPKGQIADADGQWIALTPEQYQFMRGIYAMNPQTPAGLPYGDRAVLARVPRSNGGLIFFIDGDYACTPMPFPAELFPMLNDVATGTLNHESGSL